MEVALAGEERRKLGGQLAEQSLSQLVLEHSPWEKWDSEPFHIALSLTGHLLFGVTQTLMEVTAGS